MIRFTIFSALCMIAANLSACASTATTSTHPEAAPTEKSAPETVSENATPNPLVEAVVQGDLAQVKALVEAGADVNSSDAFGFRVLVNAMAHYNSEIVDYLISKGAQTGLEKPKNDSENKRLFGEGLGQNELLLAAAESGDIKSVKRLLAAGANINAQDEAGFTVLVTAIAGAHTELIKYLVNQGATIVANSQ